MYLNPYLRWSSDLTNRGIYLEPRIKLSLGELLALKKPLENMNLEVRYDFFDGSASSQLGMFKKKDQLTFRIKILF